MISQQSQTFTTINQLEDFPEKTHCYLYKTEDEWMRSRSHVWSTIPIRRILDVKERQIYGDLIFHKYNKYMVQRKDNANYPFTDADLEELHHKDLTSLKKFFLQQPPKAARIKRDVKKIRETGHEMFMRYAKNDFDLALEN
ncbi:hypothetical protein L1987_21089 [Smallanthus sonchifolius]|uniref:Uncharacterized protein n=1 Tax=Smallanthus sonchifolius TaxID=185202 RepID=A0ACB9IV31_9ASTR|nr:hypothetical protein L1987_21089 [Smallanthus sonchifolius]